MHLYKDLGDIPIYNFDIINRTQDYKYLVVGYDGYNDVKVPKEANERWQEMRNEWVKLLDDNTISYYYELILDVAYLKTRYDVVNKLLYIIWSRDMDEETLDAYIGALREWRYIWNKKATKNKEIKRLLNIHKASENKISLKEDELNEMQKKHDLNDSPMTLEKQAVTLEQVLGKNRIDVRTTSARTWIEYGKLSTEISEQRRKSMKK